MTNEQWTAVIESGASGLTAEQLAKFLKEIVGARWIVSDLCKQAYERATA